MRRARATKLVVRTAVDCHYVKRRKLELEYKANILYYPRIHTLQPNQEGWKIIWERYNKIKRMSAELQLEIYTENKEIGVEENINIQNKFQIDTTTERWRVFIVSLIKYR